MWFERRFQESASKVRIDCQECGRAMWFPASKAGKYQTCGQDCAHARRQKSVDARTQQCLTCGSSFVARANLLRAGGGKYCCITCAEPTRILGRTQEARAKAAASRRDSYEAGRIGPWKKELSASWKGGRVAAVDRARADGRAAAATRKYRRKNPEKAREWAQNRRNRRSGRLPGGTVQRIGVAQQWRCIACEACVRLAYHVDHIQPLSRGGRHEPNNIQLLCPRCNLRKSAKDPLTFMRERGFLL